MRQLLFISVFLYFILNSSLVYAQNEGKESGVVSQENHGRSIEAIVNEIRQSQGTDGSSTIDCNKVGEKQLEELGDAVMSLMHPNPRQHEFMDNMMGGEGSKQLASYHKMMAYRYLSCDDLFNVGSGGFGMMGGGYGMGMGMMNGGMMGSGYGMPSSDFGMMGGRSNYNGFIGQGMMDLYTDKKNNSSTMFPMNMFSFGGMFFSWIFMVLIWILLVFSVAVLIRWLIKGQFSKTTALEILKQRYAKGEITKKEFEEMRKELAS